MRVVTSPARRSLAATLTVPVETRELTSFSLRKLTKCSENRRKATRGSV